MIKLMNKDARWTRGRQKKVVLRGICLGNKGKENGRRIRGWGM